MELLKPLLGSPSRAGACGAVGALKAAERSCRGTLTEDTGSVAANSACPRAVGGSRALQRFPKVAVGWQQGRDPLWFHCRHT